MQVNKFELFMCCLGNGTTVCNKAIIEHGDYKIIAHISLGGNIKLYVNEDYIPSDDMKRIKTAAQREAEDFHKRFERLPAIKQYAVI